MQLENAYWTAVHFTIIFPVQSQVVMRLAFT